MFTFPTDSSEDIAPPPQMAGDYLSALNPQQKLAVETTEGAVLVLSGAGTGKTRVLTTRIAHLLHTRRAFPSQIMAVTFTNKAAAEMRERISHMMGGASMDGWWIGTFHALAARMVRRHAAELGLTSSFTIIDPDDQIRLLKQIIEPLNLDPKKHPPKMMASIIDGFKNRAQTPLHLSESDCGDVADGKMLLIYKQYQDRLKALNACDFGDLLLHMISLFKNPNHADILADYHKRFRYILVDEYQDTNVAQYLWLRLLAQKPHNDGDANICCVGDDDQSIYGWRGAEVENILRFERDFKNPSIIRLEANYRSTAHILECANGLIAKNQNRLGKNLQSTQGMGEKITVYGLWDSDAESRYVVEHIENLRSMGSKLSQMAILVRTGAQTRAFEERLIQMSIPYRVVGGVRFYERAEIRDAMAYLRVTAQPQDDLALERIINTPKRAIGDTTIQLLYKHARATNQSLFSAADELAQSDELRGKAKAAVAGLVAQFKGWQDSLKNPDYTPNQSALCETILLESGYMDMWKDAKTPDAAGRVENLRELINSLAGFESIYDFLEHVALVMEVQDTQSHETVTLMTMHAAKGLEFDHVFLAGWEEGLFPSQRALDETGGKGLEEERRLAYVGITRARKTATITHAANRMLYGSWMNSMPSRFIGELPDEHVNRNAMTGISSGTSSHFSGRNTHWDSSPKAPVTNTPAASVYKNPQIGKKITHTRFGNGTIIHVDGNKLDIRFDNGETKRLLSSFVEFL
jgi:DNA helicase-2/ATP-dependent DNA helicase PcrA